MRFENIRVEESRKLISLWINKAIWSREAERGHIQDVTFKNIEATTVGRPRVELLGFDAGHAIDGVVFDDVNVNGTPLTIGEVATNAFVSQVLVKP